MKSKDLSVREAIKEMNTITDSVYLDEFLEGEERKTMLEAAAVYKKKMTVDEQPVNTIGESVEEESIDFLNSPEEEIVEESEEVFEETVEEPVEETIEEIVEDETITTEEKVEKLSEEMLFDAAPEEEPKEEPTETLSLTLDQIIGVLDGFANDCNRFFRKGSGRLAPSMPNEASVLTSLGLPDKYMPIIADWFAQIRNYNRPRPGFAPNPPLPARVIAQRILDFKG